VAVLALEALVETLAAEAFFIAPPADFLGVGGAVFAATPPLVAGAFLAGAFFAAEPFEALFALERAEVLAVPLGGAASFAPAVLEPGFPRFGGGADFFTLGSAFLAATEAEERAGFFAARDEAPLAATAATAFFEGFFGEATCLAGTNPLRFLGRRVGREKGRTGNGPPRRWDVCVTAAFESCGGEVLSNDLRASRA
jgi:hypothetical protein